ncbi:hypothetical protein ACNOYE_07825 [Nannocystaceae bacterium ST9]
MDRLVACSAVVGFVVVLFLLGDRWLGRESRRDLGNWLIDDARAEARVDALPRAFIEWFDALFKVRKIGVPRWLGGELVLPNFWRSALASFLALVAAFVVWLANKGALAQPDQAVGDNTGLLLFMYGSATVITNIIPDYLSLVESRWVLGRMSTTRSLLGKLAWLALDIVATSAIVFGFLWVSGWLLLPLVPPEHAYAVGCLSRESYDLTRMIDIAIAGLTFSTPAGTLNYDVSGIYIYSSFFTSFWVWLYLGSGLLVRAAQFVPGLREFLRKACKVQDYPLRVLAVVSGLVALALVSLPPLLRPLLPSDRQGTNGLDGDIHSIALCQVEWERQHRGHAHAHANHYPADFRYDPMFGIPPWMFDHPRASFAVWIDELQAWDEYREQYGIDPVEFLHRK